jgi:beta-phosphoglucomutase-like phosphatase (HAD superfamily)
MSAEAHAAAWTQVFDAFLGDHAQRHHRPFFAFDPRHDYEELVAGRPRRDGIRVFLASRGVDLPEGSPSDAPGIETVYGLAQLVDVRVDGHAMAAERLEAKPAPICCWSPAASCGSSRRGQSPSETSPAGVAAARAAEFAFVVGVAWTGEADLLRASDTDIVVTDLGELLATGSTSAL